MAGDGYSLVQAESERKEPTNEPATGAHSCNNLRHHRPALRRSLLRDRKRIISRFGCGIGCDLAILSHRPFDFPFTQNEKVGEGNPEVDRALTPRTISRQHYGTEKNKA